ncbi:glycosyl transferase GTB-type super family [Candidatus Termititenax aidoneus]|uniref:Glycosyl transferase GTB-type super family n=1 Tax=Termititenax aidoneus TaxID=2218524 RepID=A0A388TDR6_TERA1|nr:glycosyl transferase GTB-type super family [Candidatus Termititenax aidoneus]
MPNKLKILQVNKLYYPVIGGVEKVVQQIAEGLKDKTDLEVLACQDKGKTSIETINGVKVYKAGSFGRLFSMPISLSFLRLFHEKMYKNDIIHIHLPFPLADLAVFLFRPKARIALWWHSDIVRQKWLFFFYRPLTKWLLRRADRILVAAQGHIDGSDFLPGFRDKCRVVPFAVDDAVLAKGTQFVQQNVSPPKNEKKPVSVLFVGRLVYYKGCEFLLRAFAQTRNANLVIVGKGALEKRLKKLAARLGLANKVKFFPSLPAAQLDRIYADCDIFVLPSVEKTEAFGLVQIEAMAYGKPVINTNLPSGVPQVSLDGISGLTVPPKDVSALARALQRLIDEDKLRRRLGQGAYRLAHTKYTMRQMLTGVMAVYQELQ